MLHIFRLVGRNDNRHSLVVTAILLPGKDFLDEALIDSE